MRGWLLLSIALASCTKRDPPGIAAVHEISDAAPKETLPSVRTKGDVETFDHKRVHVFGTYDVEPVHPHKKGGRMTTIVLSDATHVSRSYGWVRAETAFVNKRVKVTGVITKGPPDPMMQSISGPHVQLESIELASG